MKRKIPLASKFYLYGVVPISLLLLWFIFSIFFNSYGPLSILTFPNGKSDHIDLHLREIHKGESVHGNFRSRDNNLGIVSVRFNTYRRINSDALIFRIKEKNARSWFYQNSYLVNQFQPDDFFTFGFPLIGDSKGKEYVFEMTSTKGRRGDAVAISSIYPQFLTKYQFTKQELTSNKKLLVMHIGKLFLSAISNRDFFISSLIYLLPFLLYVLWYFPVRIILSYLAKRHRAFIYVHKLAAPVIVLCLVFITVLYVRQLSSIVAPIILLSAWGLLLKRHRLGSDTTFTLALVLLLLCSVFLFFGNRDIAERCTDWVFFYLIVGGVQTVWESSHKQLRTLTLKQWLEKILNENDTLGQL